MKRVLSIAVAVCLCSSTVMADPSLRDKAATKSRARDHAAAIELYRQAYEHDSDASLLVRMAHEYRLAGNTREALAYFCSYIYVDAAGDHADEASKHARALAAQLGNPTESDHDACETKAKATPVVPAARSNSVDSIGTEVIPQPPPIITKREVVGLVLLGGSIASLALALREGSQVRDLRQEIDADVPGTDIQALEREAAVADRNQKIFLGVGAGAMITGGVLYVLGRRDRKRAERAYVAPSLSKNSNGLVYGRKF